jgi:hypothetical protein
MSWVSGPSVYRSTQDFEIAGLRDGEEIVSPCRP